MKATAPRRSWTGPLLLLLALPFAWTARPADAQVNPLWDHYKVYLSTCPSCVFANVPVRLTDQFGASDHQVLSVDLFANPVEKTVFDAQGNPITFPINDPVTHYSWWRITPQPFSAIVTATNQFGDHTLTVRDAVFLLTPARKNTTAGGPPNSNHYKVYNCDGPPINRQVVLNDQFGQWNATVTDPRFFLNPVEKFVSAAENYPILDPNQHYICYEFTPEDPGDPATDNPRAFWVDQFISGIIFGLRPSRYLCVPTLKSGVTATDKNTWGKVKLLYR